MKTEEIMADLDLGLERNSNCDADSVTVLKALLSEALNMMTDRQRTGLYKLAAFQKAIQGIGELNR